MRIEVTDVETNESTTYDLSRDNWVKRWACMKSGLVHMWAPSELTKSPGCAVQTSGRLWRVLA